MHIVRKLVFILSLLSVLATDIARAELTIEITEGIKRRPIAVVPFGWEGQDPGVPLDIAKVISDDLTRSGRFAPVANGAYSLTASRRGYVEPRSTAFVSDWHWCSA